MVEGTRPLLAITMGDAAGIGPEIVIKALTEHRKAIDAVGRPVVVGDLGALERAARVVDRTVALRPADPPFSTLLGDEAVAVHAVGALNLLSIPFGQVSAEAGAAAVAYLERAIDLAKAGAVDGIVTAPINKEAIHRAGVDFPGHTEILAERTGTDLYGLTLVSPDLAVVHLSTHLPLSEAIALVTRERVSRFIRLTHTVGRQLGYERPRIAVAGLNPHAGEEGLFGTEEREAIAPAVAEARSSGIDVMGPVSPDVVFLQARRGVYDLVLAMYHDQGHVAVKTMGFERGVNVTAGLPIVRTSVDHGTAFDIAGTGRADPTSLIEAFILAARITRNR
ncbi:MAG: 4-hydroxythreonine-4-phosphate dehydrogenase PdxA [bacterium]|nr:4-hydroxythreonine-4-phosphate dehydrogenase PdxA [bacterium]